MVMKKFLLLFLALGWFAPAAQSQDFEVRNFRRDNQDMAARMFPRTTVNNEPAALLKVHTAIAGLRVQPNLTPVGNIESREDGYWIYLVPGERRVRFMADGFNPIEFDFPQPVEGSVVYVLTLARVGAMLPEEELVRVIFRFNRSEVYTSVNNSAPVMSLGAAAEFRVRRGQNSFRFIKEGYREQEVRLDVQNEVVQDITLEPGQAATRLQMPGFLVVDSDPSNAEVFLNEQRVGTTPYQAQLPAGNYTLMLRRNLYHDEVRTFGLEEGATVDLQRLALRPRFGWYSVTSTPPGADVYLDNKLVGKTPLARAEISSGQRQLRLQYPLYHNHEESFEISDGDDRAFNITMKKAFGELVITSEPSGATLFIDGRAMGATPYRNAEMPSGRYSVRLTKDLYSEANDEVTVSDGQKTEKFIPLTMNFGTLKVAAPNAEIFLDNRKVGTGSYEANLPPGRYTLKATRATHHDATREVFVRLGQTEDITLTPTPREGILSVMSEPFETRGAEIFINGRKQQQTTPAAINLLMGSYDITLKKRGYLDATQRVTVRENETTSISLRMNTYAGSLQQDVNRYRRAKLFYGAGTAAAIGAGTYFAVSSSRKFQDYRDINDPASAKELYDQISRNDMLAAASFAVAVPLGVMTVVKAIQQGKAQRKLNVAAVPTGDGMMVMVELKF